MRISGCVLLVTTVSLVLGSCGSNIVPAPSTRALPLAPSAELAATFVGASNIMGAGDRRRFRRMDIASASETGPALLRTETRFLLQHGWRHLQVTICCKTTPSGIGEEVTDIPTSITNPRATVQLDSPDSSNYVSMSVISIDPKHYYLNDPRNNDHALEVGFRRHEGLVDVTVAASRS